MNGSLRWKVITGVLLAFLAGGATGFFFATMYAHHIIVELHQPGLVSTRMKEHLRRELNITPEQEAKIDPIVEKMSSQLEQIRGESAQRVHQTIQDAHKQISAFLTPEQKKLLDEMETRHRTWRMHHGPHPGGPDEGMPPPPPRP